MTKWVKGKPYTLEYLKKKRQFQEIYSDNIGLLLDKLSGAPFFKNSPFGFLQIMFAGDGLYKIFPKLLERGFVKANHKVYDPEWEMIKIVGNEEYKYILNTDKLGFNFETKYAELTPWHEVDDEDDG